MGKHCYGSGSLKITENTIQTVFPNQLINTEAFMSNSCLVKAENLNNDLPFKTIL